jgi:superfamily II DNA or RNA helicase
MRLRAYQLEALRRLEAGYARGARSQLITLATGLGKSLIFSHFASELIKDAPDDVVVAIAHSNELVEQLERSLGHAFTPGEIGLEKEQTRAGLHVRAVAASIQTLVGDRLDEFCARFRGRLRALVIDEAHRAAAPTYRALVERILADRDDAIVLGVTATPRRADNVGLQVVFSRIAFAMSLKDGISQGYLVPIRAFKIASDVPVKDSGGASGDFDDRKLARAVDVPARNAAIVTKYLEIAAGRKTIVFASSVGHARKLAGLFAAAGITSEAAWGSMPNRKRAAVIEAFRAGTITVLVNYSLFLEGLDVPDIEVVINARPTKSGTVLAQSIGRGTRVHPSIAGLLEAQRDDAARRALIASSAKPCCTVIDVVDAIGDVRLMTVPSLLGLPPGLDLEGRLTTEVEEIFAEVARRDPEAAAAMQTGASTSVGAVADAPLSVSTLLARLEAFDVFAPAHVTAERAAAARLQWHEIGAGVHRLALPRMVYALTRDGRRIDDFDAVLAAEAERLRNRVSGNPRQHALASLNVDPTTRRALDIAIEVRENALGEWEAWRLKDQHERKLGTLPTLVEAVERTETYVGGNYGSALAALGREDTRFAIATRQRQKLRLLALGVEEHEMPTDAADAERLIARREQALEGIPA